MEIIETSYKYCWKSPYDRKQSALRGSFELLPPLLISHRTRAIFGLIEVKARRNCSNTYPLGLTCDAESGTRAFFQKVRMTWFSARPISWARMKAYILSYCFNQRRTSLRAIFLLAYSYQRRLIRSLLMLSYPLVWKSESPGKVKRLCLRIKALSSGLFLLQPHICSQ